MLKPAIQAEAISANVLRIPLCIQRFDPSHCSSIMLSMMNVPPLQFDGKKRAGNGKID
jgi:hypothetical protein